MAHALLPKGNGCEICLFYGSLTGTMTDSDRTLTEMPAGLKALMGRAGKQKSTPPVETWNPDFCGDLDMRIAADGTWFYLGSPIGRLPLVKLFASVLRKDEDGKTYLVTPVEKIGLVVEDAHFQAVEMARSEVNGQAVLTFRTNLGELVAVDADHPFHFELEEGTAGLKAYVRVRGRLEARLSRALMYDLVALASEGQGENAGLFGVESSGLFFAICSMEKLASFEAALA